MAVEHLVAVGSTPSDSRVSHGMGGNLKGFSRTIAITAAASVNSTYTFGYVPANARIMGISTVSFGDMADTGAPTIDFGFYPVDGNITADVDGVNDGLTLATAARDAPLIKNIADYGKKAWQFVSGQTTEPKGQLLLKGVIVDAAANLGGTITVEVYFLVP